MNIPQVVQKGVAHNYRKHEIFWAAELKRPVRDTVPNGRRDSQPQVHTYRGLIQYKDVVLPV